MTKQLSACFAWGLVILLIGEVETTYGLFQIDTFSGLGCPPANLASTEYIRNGDCKFISQRIVIGETSYSSVSGECSTVPTGLAYALSTDSTCTGSLATYSPMTSYQCFNSETPGYSFRFTCLDSSFAPSPSPSAMPSASFSPGPTRTPSSSPSQAPSGAPSPDPTSHPSASPTASPLPVTPAPTSSPILGSKSPTSSPISSTAAPTKSPLALSSSCAPFFTTDISVCRNRIALCGTTLKWTGKGCRNRRGRPLGDGGCQCVGYCGYKCKNACKSDPLGECRWDAQARVCRIKATGAIGGPIPTCVTSQPVG